MNINFSLCAGLPGKPETSANVDGDVITVNGKKYDLSNVPDGGIAEPTGDHPFVGVITRTGGAISCTLVWGYDGSTAVPDQPKPAMAKVTNGPVPDPVARMEIEQ